MSAKKKLPAVPRPKGEPSPPKITIEEVAKDGPEAAGALLRLLRTARSLGRAARKKK
jgi:hypothetical protein